MRKYEMMTIFPVQEDKAKAGAEALKSVLSEFGASIVKEDSFGERELTYEVKKQTRGKFVLYIVEANPVKLVDIERQLKLAENVLKYMFVRLDEDK